MRFAARLPDEIPRIDSTYFLKHEQELSMMNRDNPVWLITGCSTGFGRELAKLVLERGWRAVVTARDPSTLKDLTEGYPENALVNNAGYGYLAAIEEGEDDAVRAMFETNVFGLVDMTKAVLPIMREQKSGIVINISSI